MVRNELNSSDPTDAGWTYLLDKEVNGKRETREVIETKFGPIDRLVAIGGEDLTEIVGSLSPG